MPLDPRLRELEGDALRLWSDVEARRSAFKAISDAYENMQRAAGRPAEQQAARAELGRAVQRIDTAVVAGLAKLDLPRGPVLRVQVVELDHAFGEKAPTCVLSIDALWIRVNTRPNGTPDNPFRTWVHESVHARKAFDAETAAAEYGRWRGYEEGLVESLARYVTRDAARMQADLVAYNYYVRAYDLLAEGLGVPLQEIQRVLWRSKTGRVRACFVDVVDRINQSRGRQPLTRERRRALRRAADTLFDSANANRGVSDNEIREHWHGTNP